MNHPLESYRLIAEPNFISRIEHKFYNDHYGKLDNDGLHVFREEDKGRLLVMGVDLAGNAFNEYITFGYYLLIEYNRLEGESRSEIDRAILEDNKPKEYIDYIIAELQLLQNAIKGSSVKPEHEDYKKLLLRESTRFIELLKAIYQSEKREAKSYTKVQTISKLRWLDKTNILTTLFSDLISGTKPYNKKLIDAAPKEIAQFIVDNFIDKDGNSFSIDTVYTNLKPSKKKEKRSKDTNSIDINSYFFPE